MAQLKVPVDNFHISTPFKCRTEVRTVYNDDRSEELRQYIHTYTEPPSTATLSKEFAFDLPKGAKVESAKVCATVGSTTYGAETLTINGVGVNAKSTVEIDVAIDEGITSVVIPFSFLSKTVQHDHFSDGTGYFTSEGGWYENTLLNVVKYEHVGVVSFTDVHLLVEYKPPIEFTGWTDDPLVVGETFVKAIHMAELQQWTALLSEYANNGAPAFTETVAGETSIALWLSQVQEIRAVLDVINPDHAQWIDVSVNCPRADVMTQLRNIIVAAI